MKRLWVASVLLTGACHNPLENPTITQCREYLVGKLRAPSTYKEVKVDVIGITDGHPGRYDVAIEYDASNSYGVPIRDFRLCSFPLKNGYPDTTGYIDFDSEADGAANAAGTIIDNDSSYSIAPGDKRPSSVQPEKGGEMESAPAGEENWVENNA